MLHTICIYTYIYIRIYIYVYVIYVCIYIYISICIYMYIYTGFERGSTQQVLSAVRELKNLIRPYVAYITDVYLYTYVHVIYIFIY